MYKRKGNQTVSAEEHGKEKKVIRESKAKRVRPRKHRHADGIHTVDVTPLSAEAQNAWQEGYDTCLSLMRPRGEPRIAHRLADILMGELELRKAKAYDRAKETQRDDESRQRLGAFIFQAVAATLPELLKNLVAGGEVPLQNNGKVHIPDEKGACILCGHPFPEETPGVDPDAESVAS